MTRVGVPEDGREVSVAAGEVLEIVLPETASTGYRWELDPLPEGAVLVEERTADLSEGIGGGATRIFVVRPGAAGLLSARLRRVWEDAEPVCTFAIRLTAPR